MLTAFFIFNSKGDVLISKLFREGVKRNISDVFRIQVISNNDVRSPILTLGSTTFLHIKFKQLWFVAVTRSNVDASIVFESLYKLIQIFGNSFQVSENDVKLNFTLIYEILDEVYEFGYPQTTEINTLHLTNEPVKTSTTKNLIGRRATILKRKTSTLIAPTLTSSSSSNSHSNSISNNSDVPWRNSGIKYRKNEIYLDVHENVNLLVSANGSTLRSYVDGTIKLKTHLSGMPVCKIGLNDSNDLVESNISLEDHKFHQCVDLKSYDYDKVIQFIPPDGEFDLMTYRSNENINLPFQIIPILNSSKTSNNVEIQVVIKSLFSKKVSAHNVELIIPVPNGTIKTNLQSSGGKLKFDPKLNSIVWKSSKFLGSSEVSIKCSLDINTVSNIVNWTKPPMLLNFIIDMYSCSGLNVRFFRIENSNMKLIKWVKYISKAGSYEVRY